MLVSLVCWLCLVHWAFLDGAIIQKHLDPPTTISAIPISDSSTVGWVPISDVEDTTLPVDPSISTSTSSTPSNDYSTTSFKDAKIQYQPFLLPLRSMEDDDDQAPIIDIELPFDNHSHVVTWLGPKPKVEEISKRDTASSLYHPNLSCGGVYAGFSGVLKSPDYPLFYPNNKHCEYEIVLPENYTVKLSCDDFHVQGVSGKCEHDYVDITWTDAESTSKKFCGTEAPSISSKSNTMTLTFKSDSLYRYKGFVCRYRAIQPNGIAPPNSFDYGDDSDTNADDQIAFPNDFFSHSGCQSGQVANADNPDSTSSNYGGVNLYSGGLWSGSCGSSNFLFGSPDRIVGGFETSPHQYPWMVSILRECGNEFCHVCGGTIISPGWILTSAHCLSTVPIEQMGVLLGDHNLYELNVEQKFLRAEDKIIHPDFNEPTVLNNDIGLLRLESDISFTKFVSPLCLPPLGETGFGTSAFGDENTTTLDTTGLKIVGKNATVIGWGMTNDAGDYPTGLHEVEVQILANSVCSDLYGPFITENMMCTSGADGRGSCYGDSGGPALVRDTDGSFVQVGIVSFGANGGCEDGYPSGQVLVHKFIDWIQHVTGLHI